MLSFLFPGKEPSGQHIGDDDGMDDDDDNFCRSFFALLVMFDKHDELLENSVGLLMSLGESLYPEKIYDVSSFNVDLGCCLLFVFFREDDRKDSSRKSSFSFFST